MTNFCSRSGLFLYKIYGVGIIVFTKNKDTAVFKDTQKNLNLRRSILFIVGRCRILREISVGILRNFGFTLDIKSFARGAEEHFPYIAIRWLSVNYVSMFKIKISIVPYGVEKEDKRSNLDIQVKL